MQTDQDTEKAKPSAALVQYWVNGIENGPFDPRDAGLLSGLSIFETLRTYGTHIFRLSYHYDRLCKSAKALSIRPPTLEHFNSVLSARTAPDVALRYLLTAGGQEVIYRSSLDLTSVGRPIRLGVIPVIDSESLPGDVKHGSRAEWVLAAEQQGVDEVLLCSPEKEILEANRSAFFVVRSGTICLPPSDHRRLSSVTLSALLDAVKTVDLPIVRGPIYLNDDFDEAYVVSTLKGLSPVTQIGDRHIQSPGPIGQALKTALSTLIEKESQSSR